MTNDERRNLKPEWPMERGNPWLAWSDFGYSCLFRNLSFVIRIFTCRLLFLRRSDDVVLVDAVAVEDAFGGGVERGGIEHDTLQGIAFHELEDVKSVRGCFECLLQVGEIIDLLPVDLFHDNL